MSRPSRQPDFISNAGTRFWFEEQLFEQNITGIKRFVVAEDGSIRRNSFGDKSKFREHIQNAYKAWKTKTAESILIGSSDENNNVEQNKEKER